uniref:Uncharacterized protein n=1 Tax=Rhizophora mucronata TaxID=61149 RepID=A0A2P2N1A4_RHIMU
MRNCRFMPILLWGTIGYITAN